MAYVRQEILHEERRDRRKVIKKEKAREKANTTEVGGGEKGYE